MRNGIHELVAVVLEPAQTRFAQSVNQTRGANAIPDAERSSPPTAEAYFWAGTMPGVMAAKRPPQRTPRVIALAQR